MEQTQNLKCIKTCKSVSGGKEFVKGENYDLIVIKWNDDEDDLECVLKKKVPNSTTKYGFHEELVDSRNFEDYNIYF